MSIERAVKTKRALAGTGKSYLRESPEYGQARERGEARDWLEREAASYADSAYELLQQRLGELDE